MEGAVRRLSCLFAQTLVLLACMLCVYCVRLCVCVVRECMHLLHGAHMGNSLPCATRLLIEFSYLVTGSTNEGGMLSAV